MPVSDQVAWLIKLEQRIETLVVMEKIRRTQAEEKRVYELRQKDDKMAAMRTVSSAVAWTIEERERLKEVGDMQLHDSDSGVAFNTEESVPIKYPPGHMQEPPRKLLAAPHPHGGRLNRRDGRSAEDELRHSSQGSLPMYNQVRRPPENLLEGPPPMKRTKIDEKVHEGRFATLSEFLFKVPKKKESLQTMLKKFTLY